MNLLIDYIAEQLIDIQNGDLWAGKDYSKRLDDINDETAFVRPHSGLHSIAEIISHLIFWRKETILKIRTGKGVSTDSSHGNWLSNEELRGKGWIALENEYAQSQEELIGLLRKKSDDFLDESYYDADFKKECSYKFVLTGLVHHDVYHLGQIGIILKFLNNDV